MKTTANVSFAVFAALVFTQPIVAHSSEPVAPAGPVSPALPAATSNLPATDRYDGYYLVGPQRAVRFWREADHLYFGAVGSPQRAEAVPAGDNRFSFANGSVVFTFNAGPDGSVSSMTVSQGGRDIAAPRIEEAVAKGFPAPGAAAAAKPAVRRTWIMMAGATPRAITSAPAGTLDYWPCFSPDGSTVLFSRTLDGGKTWSLYRVPAAGGAVHPLADLPVSATRASWSARSSRIAFNGDTPAGSNLWVMDKDGRNAHPVVTNGLRAPSYPSWYPDGRTIGFGDAVANILYRVDANGGVPIVVTHQDQVLAGMSSVSPNGQWVAFAGQKNTGQLYNQTDNQIWLVDKSGVSKPMEPAALPGRTPAWAPDGKRLAFESDRGSPNGLYAAFISNTDGTGLVQVTDYALNANHPVFSPDGRSLVFSTGDPSKGISSIAVVSLSASH